MSRQETTRYWADLGGAERVDQDPARDEYPLLKSEFFQHPLPSDAVTALLNTLVAERAEGQSRE